VSLGDYRFTSSPEEPCVLQGWHAPGCGKTGTSHERFRAARHEMYQTPFEVYERQILEELDSAWGRHGLDVDRDVAALTVNRWPHGYAYEYMDLWDPPEWGRGAGLHVIGRQQIGNISIANSDSEQYAYVNGAIDAAYRAVRELTT
jgi:spermidine dehydrogenase